ncbi:hypothetical protein M9H77_06284 [Catharanthus roseus]|uniref:Uncharacterized protein n=1 Tax=Catharanthus roseus TaxID=4058 RepID=A0ACC0BRQ5_CATRO|nr:hypothetical protein M9H77_06284 [Catharanthus roseus]
MTIVKNTSPITRMWRISSFEEEEVNFLGAMKESREEGEEEREKRGKKRENNGRWWGREPRKKKGMKKKRKRTRRREQTDGSGVGHRSGGGHWRWRKAIGVVVESKRTKRETRERRKRKGGEGVRDLRDINLGKIAENLVKENNSRTSTREFPNRMHIPKNLDDNVKLQDLTSSPITWILNVDESSRIEHKVKSDSQVVIGQVTGTFKDKEENIKKYLALVKKVTSGFKQIQFEKVPQNQNVRADTLSKLREIHEGIFGSHISMNILVKKAMSMEALIPAKVGVKSLRSEAFDKNLNEQLMEEYLRLLDELRARAAQKDSPYRRTIARYHNARVEQSGNLRGRHSTLKK